MDSDIKMHKDHGEVSYLKEVSEHKQDHFLQATTISKDKTSEDNGDNKNKLQQEYKSL